MRPETLPGRKLKQHIRHNTPLNYISNEGEQGRFLLHETAI